MNTLELSKSKVFYLHDGDYIENANKVIREAMRGTERGAVGSILDRGDDVFAILGKTIILSPTGKREELNTYQVEEACRHGWTIRSYASAKAKGMVG